MRITGTSTPYDFLRSIAAINTHHHPGGRRPGAGQQPLPGRQQGGNKALAAGVIDDWVNQSCAREPAVVA